MCLEGVAWSFSPSKASLPTQHTWGTLPLASTPLATGAEADSGKGMKQGLVGVTGGGCRGELSPTSSDRNRRDQIQGCTEKSQSWARR